jgi:hypothetical protein
MADSNETQERAPLPIVGQKVNARIQLVNDLTCDGMGVEVCANRGDELIVRRIINRPDDSATIVVSHEYITDGRGFCVAVDEIDYVYPAVAALATAQPGAQK